MSSISSASVNTAWLQTQMQMKAYASGTQKSQQAEQAFSKIDTAKQGFFDIAGLTTAVNEAVSSNQNTKNLSFSATDIETAFKKIDADGDGKVTQAEFTSTVSQLKGKGGHHHHHKTNTSTDSSSADQQAMPSMSAMAGMQGMPPPLTSSSAQDSNGVDEGFTSDELKAQLNAISESDTKRSTLINKVLNNFSAADVDGNGKVNFAEAMQLDTTLSSNGSSAISASTLASAPATQNASPSDVSAEQIQQKMMRQIMRMMQAYGSSETLGSAATSSQLSVTA
jgi:Ca2+-binding EF-hand superfamily protein